MNKWKHLEKQAEDKKNRLAIIHNKNIEKPVINKKSLKIASANWMIDKPIFECLIEKGKEQKVKAEQKE